eukprot:s2284_g9.t1
MRSITPVRNLARALTPPRLRSTTPPRTSTTPTRTGPRVCFSLQPCDVVMTLDAPVAHMEGQQLKRASSRHLTPRERHESMALEGHV